MGLESPYNLSLLGIMGPGPPNLAGVEWQNTFFGPSQESDWLCVLKKLRGKLGIHTIFTNLGLLDKKPEIPDGFKTSPFLRYHLSPGQACQALDASPCQEYSHLKQNFDSWAPGSIPVRWAFVAPLLIDEQGPTWQRWERALSWRSGLEMNERRCILLLKFSIISSSPLPGPPWRQVHREALTLFNWAVGGLAPYSAVPVPVSPQVVGFSSRDPRDQTAWPVAQLQTPGQKHKAASQWVGPNTRVH